MADNRTFSCYSSTPVTEAGYLDILEIRPVPAAGDDVIYEITTQYAFRPDLLAFDIYGKKELWWVFAQRNMDVLKDPVFDFMAGTKIYLPQPKYLKQSLGY